MGTSTPGTSTPPCFFIISSTGDNFCDVLSMSVDDKALPSQQGPTFKGKNLLLEEQIFFFKS